MEAESKHTMVERYVSEGLTGKDLDEFQSLLLTEPSLSKDIELSLEIEEALQERDIIGLRQQLQAISMEEGYSEEEEEEMEIKSDTYFGLADEIEKAVNLEVDDLDLSGLGNFLQKLHINNHAIASRETVHEIYRPEEATFENENDHLSAEDEQLFEDVQLAVREKDIIDLRANLRSIAGSISVHDHSYEEIEDFVTGESDEELSRMIAEEAMVNADLAEEIGLFSEINQAIVEEDVMKLRAGLKQIMGSETSHTRSIEDIDEYLNGNLSEEAVASFEDELMMNPGLAAELSLNIGINDAIGERDIMSLRERLQSISKEERESGTEKRGFTTTRRKQIIWYAAASIILLIAISGILRNRTYTDQQIYSEFYQPYNGIANTSRSSTTGEGTLMGEAISRMNRNENESALNIMEGLLAKDQDNYTCNFYSGLIYQEKGEYHKAIGSFAKVVSHGDNLFVEQSEWYMGLCYLSNDERDKAIRQFRKIATTGGYYQERSRSILKRFE